MVKPVGESDATKLCWRNGRADFALFGRNGAGLIV